MLPWFKFSFATDQPLFTGVLSFVLHLVSVSFKLRVTHRSNLFCIIVLSFVFHFVRVSLTSAYPQMEKKGSL